MTNTNSAASPWAPYQPTLDITQDPREGPDLSRSSDRMAYTRRLAEMLFLNYQQARERGVNLPLAALRLGC
jgi:hypothetical protein